MILLLLSNFYLKQKNLKFFFFSFFKIIVDVQTEKAFQKQEPIFIGDKRLLAVKGQKAAKLPRYYKKDIGLGIKTPKEASVGNYVDRKCPFTSNVSIRGRIITGRCVSTKMKRSIVIRRDYLHYIPKYNRFEKRHTNITAHASPAFRIKEGDTVTIGQCRPLSKTIRFNVISVKSLNVKQYKQFKA